MNLIESEEYKFSKDWWSLLAPQFEEEYMQNIYKYIIGQKFNFSSIYPPSAKVYKAFEYPFKNIRIVILGHSPYDKPNMAQGLAFSMLNNYPKISPSLINILNEVESDVYNGMYLDKNPDLTHWCDQGVFLLNTCLTVEENIPLSHVDIGWQDFTQTAFQFICDKNEPVVFMLWGNQAKEYKKYIHNKYHLVLEASHPSPFSINEFRGCKHFSKANQYLIDNNLTPIIW